MQKKTYKKIKDILLSMQATIKDETHNTSIFLEEFYFKIKIFNTDDVVSSIKKMGFLRPSTYDYETKNLRKIIKTLLDDEKFTTHNSYLSSMLHLCEISKDIKYINKLVNDYIYLQPSLVKTLTAYADNFFYEYKFNSAYEIKLEAFSHLIILCRNIKSTSEKDIIKIHELPPNELESIIDLASKIVYFKKMEIKVDFFHYKINKENKKTYSIDNIDFEKSITFSYLKYDLKRTTVFNDFLNIKNNRPTLNEVLDQVCDTLINLKSYEIRNEPFIRLCPKFSLNPIFLDLLNTDSIFLEEISQLYLIFNENFLNQNDLEQKIVDDFTVLDFLKLQRFFLLLSKFYREIIKNEKIKNKDFILRSSSIPLFHEKDFERLINQIFSKSNKNFYNLFINHISEDFYKIKDFYDLQYSPALKFGKSIIVSPTILSRSNIIRNVLWRNNINLSIQNKNDKMIETIENELKSVGFTVFTEVKFGKYDIDILAKLDNEVFIFECKNSYHPANEYELRNSFEHLVKAEKQLENLEKMLKDPTTRKNLAKKLQISLYKCNFNFSIVSSNRLFNGLKVKSYTCLNAQELINCISGGSLRIDKNVYRFWETDNFSVQELKKYTSGKLIIDYFSLAHEVVIKVDLKNLLILEKSFGYSLEEIKSFIEDRYPLIEESLSS